MSGEKCIEFVLTPTTHHPLLLLVVTEHIGDLFELGMPGLTGVYDKALIVDDGCDTVYGRLN